MEPLTPTGCDLRGFPFTPIFRSRLFGSRFHARVTDAEWRAGVTLWLKSWDQVPAGSLPDDEIDLCRLAELGRDIKLWRKVKDGALHGWSKATDGLLYHPVVAEGVNEALKRMAKRSARGTKGATARWHKHELSVPEAPDNVPEAPKPDASSIPQAMLRNGNREGYREVQAGQQIQTPLPREAPVHVNGRRRGTAPMPTLNSPWSAWEWLTDGEVEIFGPNAQRRPCTGGYYLDGVARDVADAAGIDGHAGGIDWRPIVGWLREGIKGEVIVSAIKRIAKRDDYEPKINLKYFNRPVHEEAGKQ